MVSGCFFPRGEGTQSLLRLLPIEREREREGPREGGREREGGRDREQIKGPSRLRLPSQLPKTFGWTGSGDPRQGRASDSHEALDAV